MMNQLKRDIATGNKVVMVTARADFDDKELFLDTFRKYGVDTNKLHVYRAGNSKEGTTEERKKKIIKLLLDKDDYTKAIMYDDAIPNLNSFMELKKDHPKTRFYAWHVSKEGEASEYMREGFIAEKKRKRRNKYGVPAYGPGPYGWYGYDAGYSSDSGGDGGGGESINYENFADGKNPQDKGDSRRHRIPKNATIAQLKKIRSSSTASPRKKQLAHWQINMRQGRKKK
jgi:hypothetical protein